MSTDLVPPLDRVRITSRVISQDQGNLTREPGSSGEPGIRGVTQRAAWRNLWPPAISRPKLGLFFSHVFRLRGRT